MWQILTSVGSVNAVADAVKQNVVKKACCGMAFGLEMDGSATVSKLLFYSRQVSQNIGGCQR